MGGERRGGVNMFEWGQCIFPLSQDRAQDHVPNFPNASLISDESLEDPSVYWTEPDPPTGKLLENCHW